MKKKSLPEPIVAPEILSLAKKSLETERSLPSKRCSVCGSSSTPGASPNAPEEDLCWVCRRLKISAWRDSDQQLSAQE